MEFEYERLENHILLDNLKNEVIRKTLAYMIDFNEYDNLVTIQRPHSIEISNTDICIAIIIFSGFENEEYEILKSKKNHHIVSFDTIPQTMHEFENIPIKHIDYMALFFMSLARTNNENIKELLLLKTLFPNKTVYHLRKEYILKDVVRNYDLFSLLYRKHKRNRPNNKIKNRFSASMIINDYPEINIEENLKSISSNFIKEFTKEREFFATKEGKTDLDKRKPLLFGFAIASGNNRANKAIELALSSLIYKNKIIEKSKSISLLISSNTIKINIDEIGIINDYIQEKFEHKADIVLSVNENENLGEALAVTLIISEPKKT